MNINCIADFLVIAQAFCMRFDCINQFISNDCTTASPHIWGHWLWWLHKHFDACWLLKWVQLHWVHNWFTVALGGHLLVRALIVIWLHVLQRPDRLYLHWLQTHMIAYPVVTVLTFFVWCKCFYVFDCTWEYSCTDCAKNRICIAWKLLQLRRCQNWWQFHWFLNWSHSVSYTHLTLPTKLEV